MVISRLEILVHLLKEFYVAGVSIYKLAIQITQQVQSQQFCDWLKYLRNVGISVALAYQQTVVQK